MKARSGHVVIVHRLRVVVHDHGCRRIKWCIGGRAVDCLDDNRTQSSNNDWLVVPDQNIISRNISDEEMC